ncbi:MAG TPA: alpha/beta fold hydrolase [Steroidobacteraceae bacterium]|nr:alpha/beta fold hydrolase [Steroidobacteraceae bacterium]
MKSNDERTAQVDDVTMTRREFARDGAVIGMAGLLGPALFATRAQAAARHHRQDAGQTSPPAAVRLAEYSQYFIGAQGVELARGTVVNGTQISVECQIPAEVRHPYPIVLVHGHGGQGSDWMSTPDGRPGWAVLLLEQGYKVYLVDRPAQGRAPYEPQFHGAFRNAPTYEEIAHAYTGAAGAAGLHTQWPGSGQIDDPSLDQFMAAQGPAFAGSRRAQQVWGSRAALLLDDIGPAIIVAHGDSAAFGWLAADARPGRVKALLLLEPGAPVPDVSGFASPGVPLSSLKHLGALPVAVISAEASDSTQGDAKTVEALRQLGCAAEHVQLADRGLHGNGHYMMMERNHRQVLQVLTDWWTSHEGTAAGTGGDDGAGATAPAASAHPEQAALGLSIAEQGCFWVGIGRKPMPYGTIAAGQSYVQYFVPAKVRHRYPIVMIHGGGSQITNFIGIGRRPGWLHYALQEGYRVYLYDRPGYGRAPYHPDALGPGQMRPFATLEIMASIAGAGREWPGSAVAGEDPLLAQFAAGEVGNVEDLPLHSQFCARGLNELLDRIGKCIVLTYAAGGFFGWKLADDRPDRVAAIVAAEVNGRPFDSQCPWGLTALPMTYDPPARSAQEFNLVRKSMPSDWPRPLMPYQLQAEPARQLVNLKGIPIISIVNDAYGPGSGPAQVAFLKQAGCSAECVQLSHIGLPYNTNVMPLEKNNRVLFDLIRDWLAQHAPDAL